MISLKKLSKLPGFAIVLSFIPLISLSQVPGNSPGSKLSYDLSGNKLFVYDGQNTHSFAPYGEGVLRMGFHFGQDTTYPESHSVIKAPEGDAILEDLGNEYHFSAAGYKVIVHKDPLQYTLLYDVDTLLNQGESMAEGDGSRMRFYTAPEAAWYGGGSRAIPMNRAGMNLVMLNEPFYGYGWGQERLNISIPLVVSSEGFALYFENPTPGLLSLGGPEPGRISYEASLGPQSCFVIHSTDPDSLMKPYTELTGRQPLPPLWALGYIQSRFGYENEQEARNMVNQMDAEGFPMDAIVFDLQWQGGVGEMGNLSWDLSRFPDPQGMMEDFSGMGVKSVCIADPYFTQNSQFFPMLSGLGWFTKEQNGDPYIIDDFWAGPSGLIDVTDPAAINWFWQRCRGLMENGVKGLWTDLGEPEKAPEDMFFEAGTSLAIRQSYNLRWAAGIYERFEQDFPDRRLFNLTRSGYAGMQRYSTFPWSGDVQKTFGGMYSQIPIMLGMGLCGFGYMGCDIGGFTGELNPELYTRWQQMGAFSPIMRAHGVGVPTEPIYYGEPFKSIVKDYILLRYRFLPYNYTLAYINSTTGMPLARPLFFEDPSLPEIDDEYLWGEDMLVAPVMEEGAISRNVVMPQGKWIDFLDWADYPGGSAYEISAGLSKLPLFVRAGAVIPLIPEIQHSGQYDGAGYVLKYFADPDVAQSQSMIYQDDGTTRQAELQDEYSIIHISTEYVGGNATILLERKGAGYDGEQLQKQIVLEVPRAKQMPVSVYYNYVVVPLTDDRGVYEVLDEVALYDPLSSPLQLNVKIQWSSTSMALFEINGLDIEVNYSLEERNKLSLNVFPNPLEPSSRINIGVPEPGIYQLVLLSSLGQQLARASVTVGDQGTINQFFYDLFQVGVPPGIYILSITGQDGVLRSCKVMIGG